MELRERQRELESVTAQLGSLYDVLSEAGLEKDVRDVEKLIAEKQEQLKRLMDTLSDYDSTTSVKGDPIDEQIQGVRSEYLSKQAELNSLRDGAYNMALDIADSESFIEALASRVSALDQSQIVHQYIGELTLTHCPLCLNILPEGGETGTCPLCKQVTPSEEQRTRIVRMKQEILFQIKESKSLLVSKHDSLSKQERKLRELEKEVLILTNNLNDELKRVRTKRDHDLDKLLVKRGQLESEIIGLQRQAKALSVLDDLQKNLANLQAKVASLQLSINSKRGTHSRRSIEANETITNIAKELLREDLPREEDFKSPKTVSVNFNANTFAVNDRNDFSASSIVYLKNCVHYAIFFAALKLDYFRYPRFFLCDDMEDKGMEESRSQNFQELIVKTAAEHEGDFQIIFTTSMISPKLENSELCVGEHYTKENKALRLDTRPKRS